jgi:hypothetical protein
MSAATKLAEKLMTERLDAMVERNNGYMIGAIGYERFQHYHHPPFGAAPPFDKEPKKIRDLPSLRASRLKIIELLKKRVESQV